MRISWEKFEKKNFLRMIYSTTLFRYFVYDSIKMTLLWLLLSRWAVWPISLLFAKKNNSYIKSYWHFNLKIHYSRSQFLLTMHSINELSSSNYTQIFFFQKVHFKNYNEKKYIGCNNQMTKLKLKPKQFRF